MSHVTPGRACHMLPRGAHVTCYPGARLSQLCFPFPLLCFALPLLCFALLPCDLLWFAVLGFALLGFAWLCFALLVFALLCFALLCIALFENTPSADDVRCNRCAIMIIIIIINIIIFINIISISRAMLDQVHGALPHRFAKTSPERQRWPFSLFPTEQRTGVSENLL